MDDGLTRAPNSAAIRTKNPDNMGHSATKNTPENSPSHEQQQTKQRSFLDLPTELWSKISKLAAAPSEHLTIPLDATYTDYTRLLHQPGITRTCKAIRAETLQHFYSSAVIRIAQRSGREDLALLARWLDAIGEENCRNIRALPCAYLQQYCREGVEVLFIPLKVDVPPGFGAAGEDEEDEEDIIASVRRYVLGPEPISI